MSSESVNFARARHYMVREQLQAREISQPELLEAFESLPRERFVPEAQREQAYADHPISIGHGQTISQPYVVALMLEALGPRPGDRVLDIGVGSGYQTALLARLGGHVYGVERIGALLERAREVLGDLGVSSVTLTTGDGSLGWPAHAPYDRIICGAGAPEVPGAWVEQVADGGRIVVPVGGLNMQQLVRVDRRGERLPRQELGGVRFVKLIGEKGWSR